MKTRFSIAITFLDDLYHGQGNDGIPEFPPSPHRLFQALLAAVGNSVPENEYEPVLKWLENLEPPTILAPENRNATRYQTFVPNNDADFNYERQDRLAGKLINPTRMLGDSRTVRYFWTINPEDAAIAEKAADLVRRVSAVGWGIDLVAACGELLDEKECEACLAKVDTASPSLVLWAPSQNASSRLRCPIPGTLDNLKHVYQTQMNRFKGKKAFTPATPPTVFSEVAYKKAGTRSRPTACFLLRDPEDSDFPVRFDQRDAMYVAAMLRHAVLDHVKTHENKTPFDDSVDVEVFIAGHLPEKNESDPLHRLSYLPIPTINPKRNDDGLIRRVIVAEPFGSDGRVVRWLSEALHMEELVNEKGGAPEALLFRPESKSDGVFDRYRKPGRTFASVTPVILPGYDDRSYVKAEKLVLKSFEQAGFARDEIEYVDLYKAPHFPGSFHPRDYVRPAHLSRNSAIHVVFALKNEVEGPLALGPGRHLGFGLCAAVR